MITESRKHRVKQTAEIFTPDSLVNEILDKLTEYGPEVWEEGKTFCDPACGNGQFLVAVLLRKIYKGHDPLVALKTIYGADIMRDNIKECRLRLLKVISLWHTITEDHIKAVFQNIVWINPKKHPGGSLDYDFSFPNKTKFADVNKWMEKIHKHNMLDEVDLPVCEVEFSKAGEVIDIFAREEMEN